MKIKNVWYKIKKYISKIADVMEKGVTTNHHSVIDITKQESQM